MPALRSLSLPCLLLLILVVLMSACDSGPSVVEEAVPGEYRFETLRFRFGTDNVVNLRDTLVTSETRIVFLSRPRFLLFYQIKGRPGATVAEGQYSVSGRRVVLRGLEEDVNRGLFEDILLPAEFRLTYDDSTTPLTLRGSFNQTVNLHAFDPNRYPGFREIQGTLQIVLARR